MGDFEIKQEDGRQPLKTGVSLSKRESSNVCLSALKEPMQMNIVLKYLLKIPVAHFMVLAFSIPHEVTSENQRFHDIFREDKKGLQ